MPETSQPREDAMTDQPSREAMAAARGVCHRHAPGFSGRSACMCHEIARALDAFAAEHGATAFEAVTGAYRDQRDAATARAEAAEAESTRWAAQFESTNAAGIALAEKLAAAEAHVKALVEALEAARKHVASFPCSASYCREPACNLARKLDAALRLAKGESA